jgi:crotonobetainyl-CoA:carnitine CoA-transferase CaiB-like acyl-CoA transferase
MTAPLEGVLVLDLSRILAGPFCTMMLGDLGARVIKVEHPEGGDVTRGWGPPDEPSSGLSAYYLSINRNKESIALDLATREGAESVRLLARRADVVLENFPPGGLEKFGLSLEQMRKENLRLVTASITGFGRAGPEAAAPGFDLLAQAGTGIMAITGEVGGGPVKVGVAVSDLLAGCYAAIGVAAALAGRERTGAGTHIEIDLFTSSLASLVNVAQATLVTGVEAVRHGNAHAQIVPYRTFTAADGDFVIAAGTDRQFARLAALLGHPEWGEDPLYRTNTARIRNRDALETAMSAILHREPRAAWLARLREAGVPVGPVAGPLEALRSETARALGAVVVSEGVPFVASPIHVAGHAPPVSFPPALDADGEKLRREFGLPRDVERET